MTAKSLARYLNPWARKADQRRLRLEALRQRDGDNCRRCRRPMRFDLPQGHDQAPRFEEIVASRDAKALDGLCLTHTRCNAEARDNTQEVQERVQLKAAAAPKPRKRRKPTRAAA